MRFQDALPTSANSQANGSYAAAQAYPGDMGQPGVDNTYTGTVQSQGASRSTAGILRPRPNGAIGQGQPQMASPQMAPQVNNQPFPQVAAAPASPSGSGVARQALPTVGAQQQAPQLQQPQQGQVPGGWTVSEQNGQVPGQPPAPASNGQVAVLPQPPRVDAEQRTPAATPAANAPSGSSTYTVVSGDTLSSISRKTGASTTAIREANGLNDTLIRVGQRLTIPSGGTTTVAASAPANAPRVEAAPAVTGSTQPSAGQQQPAAQPASQGQAAQAPRVEQGSETQRSIEEAALNPAQAPNATGISSMRWPVRGRVVSGFGQSVNGKRNDGIDISVPEGTSVRAAENGVVIYAGDGLQEFGNTVLVRHESGLVTVYGHASELKVRRGDNVRRGQEIALSGLSGSAEQPKLHFEVRKDSAPVDPTGYLE